LLPAKRRGRGIAWREKKALCEGEVIKGGPKEEKEKAPHPKED